MSEADISILTDTLRAQQKLLHRVYNELEAERDSSASAANEALSVILRLQEEKAAIKMESEHYKRLVEEKMRYDEEYVAVNEDIIYQKEMELLSLSYQVQVYKHKLLSICCVDDPDIDELTYNDNILQGNEAKVSDKVGRGHSELEFNDVTNECTSNNSLEMNCVDEIHVEDEYCEEINEKSLDIEKSDSSATRSINSLTCANFVNDSKEFINEIRLPTNLLQSVPAVDYHCSLDVYDVFEVPQIDRNLEFQELVAEERKETDHDVVHPEAIKLYARDEYEGLKKFLLQIHCDDKLCKTRDISAIDGRVAVSEPSTSGSVSQPRLTKLDRESDITEIERSAEATNRKDKIKLLNEIKQQIKSIRDEIRRAKVKKRPAREDPSLRLLSEAMIYFWF